jgi:hypothetical protein
VLDDNRLQATHTFAKLEYLTKGTWVDLQEKDPVLKRVREILANPGTNVNNEVREVLAYLHLGKLMRIQEGVLVYNTRIPGVNLKCDCRSYPRRKRKQNEEETCAKCMTEADDLVDVPIVPDQMLLLLFRQFHGRPEQGHFCYERVYPLMRQRFFWVGMARDIAKWLRACDSCQKVKGLGRHKTRMPLKQEQVQAPMDRVAVDVMGPWPTTAQGHRYILIYTDYYSKWIELFPLRRHDAAAVAAVLVNEVLSRYGTIGNCTLIRDQSLSPHYIKKFADSGA